MKYLRSDDTTIELNLLSNYNDCTINDLYCDLQRKIKTAPVNIVINCSNLVGINTLLVCFFVHCIRISIDNKINLSFVNVANELYELFQCAKIDKYFSTSLSMFNTSTKFIPCIGQVTDL